MAKAKKKKYVVHETDNQEGNAYSMYMIEASNDEAAIRFVLDIDTPSDTEEEFDALVHDRMDETSGDGPFYMIFSVEDDKVIFE